MTDVMARLARRLHSPGAMFDQAPLLLFWEMTQACELACLHCRACAVPARDPLELSTAEGERLLADAAGLGVKLVVLTGGDPAMRPDLVYLVGFGQRLGLRMALTPSATSLVTRELLAELKVAGLARLAVSLDGVEAAEHDRFRGVPGSFARTLTILEEARSLGLTTQINTTLTPDSVDSLERFAELLGPLGIELWSVFVLVATGRAQGAAGLTADQLEAALVRLAALAERVPFDVKTTAAPHFRRVLLTHRKRPGAVVGLGDGIGRAPRGINDGQGIVFVSHRGEIFPSGFLPVRCGSVRDEGLAQVYRHHPLFRSLRDPDELRGKCGVCEFKRVCGGSRARAYAELGDPLEEDPACSYMPRPLRQEQAS